MFPRKNIAPVNNVYATRIYGGDPSELVWRHLVIYFTVYATLHTPHTAPYDARIKPALNVSMTPIARLLEFSLFQSHVLDVA